MNSDLHTQGTSSSEQYGVMWTKFVLLHETTKKGTLNETMLLDIRYQVVQSSDPWERGRKWGKPYNCPSLLPEEQLQATLQGGGPRSQIRKEKWESEKWLRIQWLAFSGQSCREERAVQRESSNNLKSFFLKSSAQYWLGQACEETAWG